MRRAVAAVIVAAVACGGNGVDPRIQAACHAVVQPISLNIAADSAVDPGPSAGCVIFAANTSTTDSAEYLLVPQAAASGPDFRSSFRLAGGAPILAVAPIAAQREAAPASPAQRFHDQLRLMERNRDYPAPVGQPGSAALAALQAVPGVDTVGNQRTFPKVLANITNSAITASVVATAQSVGQHIVLYVDNAAPAGGLTTPDYDKLRSDFDTLLYATDTAAFGRESDIDVNGRVIVLMTNVVNKMVTAADCIATGYIAGFFFGADIDPRSRVQWNNGEIFYSVVPDPSGTLSCAHSVSQVKSTIPVTFIHEFQHMISYNQHVLVRGGFGEDLWLNEGMSHYAEELSGRVFLKAGDSTRFCEGVRGDLYNYGLYLTNPGAYALVDTAGIGGLAQRGAYWSFIRYLVDQFAADTGSAAAAAFTKLIDQTSTTGTANLAQVTGVPFATLAKRWVLANWVSDLPGFSAPNVLKYKHWAFRSAFPTLHASCTASLPTAFPLVAPGGPGENIHVAGTIYAGSAGTYQRALQPPGGGQFTLVFSDSTGGLLSGTVLPRLNVLRIR